MNKAIVGKVVSVDMNETVVVTIDWVFRHPKYLKMIRRTTRFLAQNKIAEVKVGDTVKMVQIKPVSKNINYRIEEKI